MNSFSFFFSPDQVYQLSLKALEKRRFELVHYDENSGVINAKQKKTWIKPEVDLQIQISSVSEHQTKVNVLSKVKKNWLSVSGEDHVEQQFFETLFSCFDNIDA